MVDLLVELGVNVNSVHDDMLPLTIAADMQDMDLCIHLMNLGAHLGVQSTAHSNSHMPNPIALSIQVGQYRAVEYLLYLGADPNCEVSWNTMVYKSNVLGSGSRLLHLAVAKRNVAVVKTLVEHRASIFYTDFSHNNPLHVACKDRDIPMEVMEYFLLLSLADLPGRRL